MIPLEKLKAVKHIVTHENCPDGVASAMILRDVLPDAKVTFVQYGTPALAALQPEEGMLFCDISPDTRVSEFIEAGVICLDHHKTQKDTVLAFGDLGAFGDEVADPGVCGAVLAYREVWEPLSLVSGSLIFDDGVMCVASGKNTAEFVASFAALAGIRDTWQREDSRWQEACEQSEALTFWPVQDLIGSHPDSWANRMSLGGFLFERKKNKARQQADNGYRFTTPKGTRCIVFEGMRVTSDASEYLGGSVDLIMGFATHAEGGKPVVMFSTRSHTFYNCADFCKSLGGGGHTKAAGFRYSLTAVPQPPPHPFYLAEQLVCAWEASQYHMMVRSHLGDLLRDPHKE